MLKCKNSCNISFFSKKNANFAALLLADDACNMSNQD